MSNKYKIITKRVETYPSKRSINMIPRSRIAVLLPTLIMYILLAVLLLTLLVKIGIFDVLAKINKEQAEIDKIYKEVENINKSTGDYDALVEQFQYYCIEYLDDEEILIQNRVEIIELIQRVIASKATVTSVVIKNNELNIKCYAESLEVASNIIMDLSNEPIVEFAEFQTGTSTVNNDDTRVALDFIIILADVDPNEEVTADDEAE